MKATKNNRLCPHQSFTLYPDTAMKRFAILFLVLACCPAFAAASELFPFVISFDAPKNAANISSWLDAPAGKHGFVRVEGDQFVTDKGRIKFWGTNTCFAANFLPHELADRMADRMARFGINCVRLHHMDMRDIFPERGEKTRMALDPAQLDKLDYYVAALKKRGIYVNLNLHVSRTLDERDGFQKYETGPSFQKGVDNYYRPIIEANKDFARQILNHVNPYTGKAYKDEPAVAMVEINNENSIVCMWGGWGGLDTIQGVYLDDLGKQWNDWLKAKYKTDAALQKAWDLKSIPLGNEMLKNGDFPKGYVPNWDGWTWEIDGKTDAPITNPEGRLRMDVRKKGEVDWHPQLIGSSFAVKKNELYTLVVKAKADKPTTITVGVRMNHDPWEGLGFDTSAKLTTDWQTLTFNLLPSADDSNARVTIGSFQSGIVYEIDSISLKPGGNLGLPEGCSLAVGNVPVIWKKDAGSFTKPAVDDFCDFLFDIEAKYWDEMYRFLKDEIKVKQPVSGTQLEYGSTIAQAKMDYCDIHSYWNHPTFPNRQWDMKDWYLRNRALVNYVDRDILPNLATKRVAGKPYTVSEFNAPYPNQYAAEALPMLAAFGAFQDWDGFFPFAYSHSNDPEPKMATSFFDTCGNSVQMAHMIACHALFCSNVEGKREIVAPMTAAKEREIFKKDRHQYNLGFSGLGLDKRAALTSRVAVDVSGGTKEMPRIPEIPKDQKVFSTDEYKPSSFHYSLAEKDRGYMHCATDKAGLFTGFIPKAPSPAQATRFLLLGTDWQIAFGETNLGWATASLTRLDDGKTGPERYLLVITGEMTNTGMKLEPLGEDKVTVGNRWGSPPVLCEGVPAQLFLKGKTAAKVKCWPLDASGNRQKEFSAASGSREAIIELKPEYKTIWYEIQVSK